MEINALII